jgi:hypothetical protein
VWKSRGQLVTRSSNAAVSVTVAVLASGGEYSGLLPEWTAYPLIVYTTSAGRGLPRTVDSPTGAIVASSDPLLSDATHLPSPAHVIVDSERAWG